jgi:predicted nucleic acid-binding protein
LRNNNSRHECDFGIEKAKPNPTVVRWFAASNPNELFLNDITVIEMAYEAERHLLKHGSDRYHLSLGRLIHTQFKDRIARWPQSANALAGHIRARREMTGSVMSVQDAMIAAICLSHNATLATRNVRDFERLELPLVNPFEER